MWRARLISHPFICRALIGAALCVTVTSYAVSQEAKPDQLPASSIAEVKPELPPAAVEPPKPTEEKPTEEKLAEAKEKKPESKKPEAKTQEKSDEAKPSSKKSDASEPPSKKSAGSQSAQQSNSPNSADERLNKIEKQLDEIGKFLQSLKQSPSTDANKTTSSAARTAEPTKEWNGEITRDWLKGIRWRGIGPANMGGRITDIAVNETDPSTWWAATASGGLIKTTNNGISFQHQFDKEATVAIGSVAVAKSDPNIVWVGTGENNPRNSVSYGDGIYKSIDGGKTWKNMGLKQSFQIGEIVIHPTDANIVYVGALGRLYGNNEERGLYKTVDGGVTWERCFYIDDRTGIIDLQLHPNDPNTIIVAAWSVCAMASIAGRVAKCLCQKVMTVTIQFGSGDLAAGSTNQRTAARTGRS